MFAHNINININEFRWLVDMCCLFYFVYIFFLEFVIGTATISLDAWWSSTGTYSPGCIYIYKCVCLFWYEYPYCVDRWSYGTEIEMDMIISSRHSMISWPNSQILTWFKIHWNICCFFLSTNQPNIFDFMSNKEFI